MLALEDFSGDQAASAARDRAVRVRQWDMPKVAKGVAKGLAALDRSRPTIVVGVSNGAVPALDLAQEARAGSVRGERLKGGAALN